MVLNKLRRREEMGVKTTVFGPRGWLVLESIADMYDRNKFSKQLYELMCQFFILFSKVIPCIYCRISFRGFTDPRAKWPVGDGVTRPSESNIREMLLKRKARFLVYTLHNGVQDKLRVQEQRDHPARAKRIEKEWAARRITFQRALEDHFFNVESEEFWDGLTTFLALSFCDYRENDCSSFFDFFNMIGKILKAGGHAKLGDYYLDTLALTSGAWKRDMDFDTRMDIAWCLYKRMYDYIGVEYYYSRASLAKLCEDATVKDCVEN